MAMHEPLAPRGLTRRRMAMALPLLGAAAWVPAAWAGAPAAVERSQRALMGTQVDMVAHGPDAPLLRAAMDRAWREMERLTARMTRYQPGSTVSAINRAAGRHAVSVEPEVLSVLQAAHNVALRTHGAFDATVGALRAWRFDVRQTTVPASQEIEAQRRLVGFQGLVLDEQAGTAYLKQRGMALDLGGIAKLPILEAGMRTLRAQGVEHAMLNGGGDVLVAGQLHGRAWRVGLRDPRAPERLLGVLHLEDQAIVASSGDYERYFMAQGERQHHILNPATGRPTQGPHGVSLWARDVASVNGLGTALMVMGSAGAPGLLKGLAGVEALVVERDHGIWQTDGVATALRVG